MRISPARGASLHPTNPPPFGSRVHEDRPTLHPLRWKEKVTSTVAPGGTTLGVADPTSRPKESRPPWPRTASPAGNSVDDRDVQGRAFGGTGPARGGTGAGVGVGARDVAGRGREGRHRGGGETPPGTYSAAEPVPVQRPPRPVSPSRLSRGRSRRVAASPEIRRRATGAWPRRGSRTRCPGRTARQREGVKPVQQHLFRPRAACNVRMPGLPGPQRWSIPPWPSRTARPTGEVRAPHDEHPAVGQQCDPLAALSGSFIVAIGVQDPVSGSYSSAESDVGVSPLTSPPATSTLPSGSRTAA